MSHHAAVVPHHFAVHIYETSICVEDKRVSSGSSIIQLGVEVRDPTLLTLKTIDSLPDAEKFSILPIHLIYGVYSLLSGPHLAAITSCNCIGKTPTGERLFNALEMKLIPICSSSAKGLTKGQRDDEQTYIQMLRDMIATPTSNIKASQRAFYFSMDYPLAISQQRNAQSQSSSTESSLWRQSETRFFWNHPLMGRFIAAGNLDAFIVPVICGFVQIVPRCDVNGIHFDLLFITRKSRFRAGTRFCVRGADKFGNVANFAETEMVLFKHDGSLLSYVQIRGSIPLYWDQQATLKYMPRTRYVNRKDDSVMDWNELAFNQHITTESDTYGALTLVNLIDKIGTTATIRDQIQLGSALGKYVKRYAGPGTCRHVWFDFHHECRALAWHNLSKLVTSVSADFALHGVFETNAAGRVVATQQGVFRTNCMDNLDRTNVVQSLFARRALLSALGAHDEQYATVLDSPYVSFEHHFKNVWADNADAVSFMYAGTGALKTDFTRTGTRTLAGALADGKNSLVRYYLNNFADGTRQDAYDLLVGNYVPSVRQPSPFTTQQRYSIRVLVLRLLPFLLAVTVLICHTRQRRALGWDLELKGTASREGWTMPLNVYSLLTALGTLAAVAMAGLMVAVVGLGKKGYGQGMGRWVSCKPVLCTTGYPDYQSSRGSPSS